MITPHNLLRAKTKSMAESDVFYRDHKSFSFSGFAPALAQSEIPLYNVKQIFKALHLNLLYRSCH